MQVANVVTAADGSFIVNWAVPFTTSSPYVNAAPVNAGSQPIICNVLTRSATQTTGKCWQTQVQAVALISLTVNIAPANASGVTVAVVGRDQTQ